MFFEHDDHLREYDNRQVANDNDDCSHDPCGFQCDQKFCCEEDNEDYEHDEQQDNETYHSFVVNERITNFHLFVTSLLFMTPLIDRTIRII